MLDVTPTKLKRVYKAMTDIACRETDYNPFKGSLYFHNGWIYATDSFSIVRVELSWLHEKFEWGRLYVVEGIDEAGYPTLGEDAVCERYNTSGNAGRLAEMYEPDMKEPDCRVATDCKYLMPALKCFNILKLPVELTRDSKRLFMQGDADVRHERYVRHVRMEALVMHIRLK